MKTIIQFEKNKLNKEKTSTIMKVNITGDIKETKTTDKKPLNLSLVLDASSSMQGAINNQINHFPASFGRLNSNLIGQQPNKPFMSKLALAKQSIKETISNMSIGDYVSIVMFSESVNVHLRSTKITDKNKQQLINTVDDISVGGMTNLHGGWIKGAQEVLDNYQDSFLNRVLLFTDGQANVGVTDLEEFAVDVKKVTNQGISTTTFGIGADFNELMLQNISLCGDGNSYFIEEAEDFYGKLMMELQGANMTEGTNVYIDFKFNNDVSLEKLFNDFNKTDKGYQLGNIVHGKTQEITTQINYQKPVEKLGEVVISYVDSEGNKKVTKKSIKANYVSDKEWKELKENLEVTVKTVEFDLANKKEKIADLLRKGDVDNAKSIFNQVESELLEKEHLFGLHLSNEIEYFRQQKHRFDNPMMTNNIMKSMAYSSYGTKYSRNC